MWNLGLEPSSVTIYSGWKNWRLLESSDLFLLLAISFYKPDIYFLLLLCHYLQLRSHMIPLFLTMLSFKLCDMIYWWVYITFYSVIQVKYMNQLLVFLLSRPRFIFLFLFWLMTLTSTNTLYTFSLYAFYLISPILIFLLIFTIFDL